MKDLLINMINLAFDLESKGDKESAISMLTIVSNHVSNKLNELRQNQEDNGNLNTDSLNSNNIQNTINEQIQGHNKNGNYVMKTVGSNLLFIIKDVQFTMIQVEGGTYNMGATKELYYGAYNCEKPVHSETVNDFWIGETEVTQALWETVVGSNPSHFNGSSRPVECVSWDDCQTFVNKLNSLLSGQLPAGRRFRLPTEAEWEYVARGGNKSGHYRYSGSHNLGSVAWYFDNSDHSTHDVKTKNSNELGIYDMSGNVYEWCEDNWRDNYNANYDGSFRVTRGGMWSNFSNDCRVSCRCATAPSSHNYIGLRLAL